jgi:hypothetical protein
VYALYGSPERTQANLIDVHNFLHHLPGLEQFKANLDADLAVMNE